MRKKKGFTLIELIIVIAIIGILLGVLIPSWGYFLQRARTRTANNKAKAIFNAAQTVVTDMNFAERKYIDTYNKTSDATKKLEALGGIYSHVPGKANEFYFYWDGQKGYRVEANGTDFVTHHPGYEDDEYTNANKSEWNRKISDSIMKIVDDQMVYKIYVKDYVVQSVAVARFSTDRYIGTYPINLDTAEENGVDIDEVRKNKVLKADMKQFNLDTTDDAPEEEEESEGT